MLVLTRHIGESIIIGDNIKLRVLDVRRNQVRVGIDAPRDVEILREELLDDDARGNYQEGWIG